MRGYNRQHVSGNFEGGLARSYLGPEDPDEAVHHITSLKEDTDES